ncbi:MAG: hypothetical protein H6760_04860 [Candidatus Nomurabacteria bacterium]|nr:MAG: hypothetical protein H6760_04860 [Candidatus Nomurabacteria bacterium]
MSKEESNSALGDFVSTVLGFLGALAVMFAALLGALLLAFVKTPDLDPYDDRGPVSRQH